MAKIDYRKNYYLVVDVETACSMSNPMVYDNGFAIVDSKGNIYETFSHAIPEIMFDENKIFGNPTMMNTAYYADKIPQYYEGIWGEDKKWEIKSLLYSRAVIHNLCKKYRVKGICAYNAQFDTRALDATIRYITKSAIRDFFPVDIPVIDIWVMACQTICQQNKFFQFCIDNEFISEANNVRTSAEVVYSYLINEVFTEAHTGLEDVKIEAEIFIKCLKLKKKDTRTEIEPMPWKIPQDKFHAYQIRKGICPQCY